MNPTTRRRTSRKRQEPTFEFLFEEKEYIIHAEYGGKPAQFVLRDGRILHVIRWIIGVKFTPEIEGIETFDPAQQSPEELAKQPNVFIAELVQPQQQPEEEKPLEV